MKTSRQFGGTFLYVGVSKPVVYGFTAVPGRYIPSRCRNYLFRW